MARKLKKLTKNVSRATRVTPMDFFSGGPAMPAELAELLSLVNEPSGPTGGGLIFQMPTREILEREAGLLPVFEKTGGRGWGGRGWCDRGSAQRRRRQMTFTYRCAAAAGATDDQIDYGDQFGFRSIMADGVIVANCIGSDGEELLLFANLSPGDTQLSGCSCLWSLGELPCVHTLTLGD